MILCNRKTTTRWCQWIWIYSSRSVLCSTNKINTLSFSLYYTWDQLYQQGNKLYCMVLYSPLIILKKECVIMVVCPLKRSKDQINEATSMGMTAICLVESLEVYMQMLTFLHLLVNSVGRNLDPLMEIRYLFSFLTYRQLKLTILKNSRVFKGDCDVI